MRVDNGGFLREVKIIGLFVIEIEKNNYVIVRVN